MDDELRACALAAYGWPADIAVQAGPRGALGQVWRVDVGADSFAVKEIFDEPPTDESISAELEFVGRVTKAGVTVPASRPDRDGRYLVTAPGGRWLRCYDWVDMAPVDETSPRTALELGALLARLHRNTCAAATETDGTPADRWYDTVPIPAQFEPVAHVDSRLGSVLRDLPALCAAVTPADPAQLIMCHRDLHPENVFTGPRGDLVVVDFDDMGPAVAGRELARVVFDWCCDASTTDLDAVRAMFTTYVEEGGPGRIDCVADFSMLLACRLNFLLNQARLAGDPQTEARHRDWAAHEVDVMLELMPSRDQLVAVLAVADDCFR